MDLHTDSFGFLRSEGYDSGDDDIYVPHTQVRRFRLRTGDFVEGLAREKHDDREKFSPLIYINQVNGEGPENLRERRNFEDLTPLYPDEKIDLEWGKDQYSMRIINLISPIEETERSYCFSSQNRENYTSKIHCQCNLQESSGNAYYRAFDR